MPSFSRYKIAVISLGAVSGALTYYQLNSRQEKFGVNNSWTTNDCPAVKWDWNWDHRAPKAKPKKCDSCIPEDTKHHEKMAKAKSKAIRHILLVRHGQYVHGDTDEKKKLTDLGKLQADATGTRLATLNVKWDALVKSTKTRAQETASIIAKHLPHHLKVVDCSLIAEGAPVPPEPPVDSWSAEDRKYFEEGARIEAGFRRYFHRAPPEQEHATHTLLVCHANVIRYFVCRALQLPPEAWLRMNTSHGSVTWVSIMPDGYVVLQSLNDTGFMDPKCIK